MIPPGRLIRKYGFRPKKGLGQHFLKETSIVSQIIEYAQLKENDLAVEIGAGLGALTGPIASRVRKILALEIDPRLVDILRKEFNEPHLEIVPGDALKFSFNSLARRWGAKVAVIGNLPYNISTPIIFRLLKEREAIRLMLLMFQKEVALRLTARPGSKDYGLLTVKAQLYCDVELLMVVPAHCFYPTPQIDSALVRLVPLRAPRVALRSEENFFRVAGAAFAYRRKTLENSLLTSGLIAPGRERIKKILISAGIDPVRRAETLSLEELAKLSDALGEGPGMP